MSVYSLTKQISTKNIFKIVLFIGLFFIILVLSFRLIPITKDSPTLIGNNETSKKMVLKELNDKDLGSVKGLSTQPMSADNFNDTKAIWQDFIDERLEFTQPKVALATYPNQNDNSNQSSNQLTNQPINQITNQQTNSSVPLPQENSGQVGTGQLNDFTISSFEPKDKSSFTQGDKIVFKVEAKDTINEGLILYKFYIDNQPISDWTDKNSLEWVTTNTSAPAKHTATVEVKNSKGTVINKTQEFFLYLKPIGFE